MENGKWKMENGGTRTTASGASRGIICNRINRRSNIDVKDSIIPGLASGAIVLGQRFLDTHHYNIHKTLVTIMLANNEIGTIQPINNFVEIAHKYGAYFHTDAVQAVGHVDVNVNDLGVDLLSASAHKFYGPKGVGFLYVHKGTKILSYLDGGSQEKKMRAGTENVANIVGMAVALKNCIKGLKENTKHLTLISDCFYHELDKLGIEYIINGDKEQRIPGNVNISIKNSNSEILLHRLDLKGIYIAVGAACDSKNTKLSHVIKAIKVPRKYAEGTLRISFGNNNTIADGKMIATAISKILAR